MCHSEHSANKWILLCFLSIVNECALAWSRDHPTMEHMTWSHRPLSRIWSEWSHWSECSRTCETGVRQRTRSCRTRLTTYKSSQEGCLGASIEYKLCSQHACPFHTENFLDHQCSQRNGHMIAGKRIHSWTSHHHGSNPCELQCRSIDPSLMYSFGKVIDGTTCTSLNARDIAFCVNGRCTPVDCAGFLGIDNRRDSCGVCRGDNSTCVRHRSTFLGRPRKKEGDEGRKDRHYDYDEIFRIPVGATHILVSEESDTNFLAVSDLEGKFMVNGNWRVQSPERFSVQGAEFTYNRTWDGRERLSSEGPTKNTLIVMVLGSGNIPTIHYEYWTSTSFHHNPQPPTNPLESPAKYHYDAHPPQTPDSRIEPSLHVIPIPPNRHQGYRSYYHRNEILKSVPSWSAKRHGGPKLSTSRSFANTKLYLGSPKERENTTDHRSYSEYFKSVLDSKTMTDVAHVTSAIPFHAGETQMFNNNTKSFDGYGRPNGTLAFSKMDYFVPRTRNKQPKRVENTLHTGSKNGHQKKTEEKYKIGEAEQRRGKRKKKSNKDGCPPCPKIKEQTKNFCTSDFVLRATVLNIERQQHAVRFELEVTRSFKNNVPTLSREYVWTPDLCLCPRLRTGLEYILMGLAKVVPGRRESKLVLDQSSFVRKYSQKRERTMLKLIRDKDSACKKFGIRLRV